jgi:hypothetical protein
LCELRSTSQIDDKLYAVVNVNTLDGVDPALLCHSSMTLDDEDKASRLARRKRNWISNVNYTEESDRSRQ